MWCNGDFLWIFFSMSGFSVPVSDAVPISANALKWFQSTVGSNVPRNAQISQWSQQSKKGCIHLLLGLVPFSQDFGVFMCLMVRMWEQHGREKQVVFTFYRSDCLNNTLTAFSSIWVIRMTTQYVTLEKFLAISRTFTFVGHVSVSYEVKSAAPLPTIFSKTFQVPSSSLKFSQSENSFSNPNSIWMHRKTAGQ